MKRSRLKEKSYNQLGEASRELEGYWEQIKKGPLNDYIHSHRQLISLMDESVENIVEVTEILINLKEKMDNALGD